MRSSNRQNTPSEDRCTDNALKGIEARRPPLPGARWPSRRLPEAEWAAHSLAPGERGWPPTSNQHVALATCHPLYPNTVELAITPLAEATSGSLSPCGRGLGRGRNITPARKFRMLLHINPTRQRGKRTGSLAGASGWYMTFGSWAEIGKAPLTRKPNRPVRKELERRAVPSITILGP